MQVEQSGHHRFAGDRYQRLLHAAEVLAADQSFEEGSFPFDGCGLRAFVATIAEQRMLDGLSEHDSDRTSMMLLLDYHAGPGQMSWRITEMLTVIAAGGMCDRDTRNTLAIISALTVALEAGDDRLDVFTRMN